MNPLLSTHTYPARTRQELIEQFHYSSVRREHRDRVRRRDRWW